MTNILILYVATFFLPLLFHSWRVALLGLGVQGLLLAILAVRLHESWSPELVCECAWLLAIRGIFVPWYLHRRMSRAEDETQVLAYLMLVPFSQYRGMQGLATGTDFSLISKNLRQWTLAFALLVTAFVFGYKMAPGDLHQAFHVATAAGAILIGLLVLANQNHPLGQIIGLFTIEGGITLIELLSPHAVPFPVGMGVSLTLLALTLTCGQYLQKILAIPPLAEEPRNKDVL
jgi:hydrogenase-4 membrane subunit HyfE